MPLFSGVQSLRLRNLSSNPPADFVLMAPDPYAGANGIMDVFGHKRPPHSSHPNFANLTLLVFEAVMEVVCVSLPGYIVARMGMFDANAQKFVANLNTQLFTPCLSRSTMVLSCVSVVHPPWKHTHQSKQACMLTAVNQSLRSSRHSSAPTSWSSSASSPSSSSSN